MLFTDHLCKQATLPKSPLCLLRTSQPCLHCHEQPSSYPAAVAFQHPELKASHDSGWAALLCKVVQCTHHGRLDTMHCWSEGLSKGARPFQKILHRYQQAIASPVQSLLHLRTPCVAAGEASLCGMCRSDGVEEIALGGAEKEVQGLDVARFSAAPAEAMAATLEYLRYVCLQAG